MPLITRPHRLLQDILVQYACFVAMATTTEPHGCVPEDLKDIMRASQLVDASDPWDKPQWTVDSCALGLIFVARREPDLFPKRFARDIVHRLEPSQLWKVACDVVGLDVEGIDVARITNDYLGKVSLWESLHARTPNATEILIAPQPFVRILDAYEEQVERKRLTDIDV
jgi:hypothetical protein